MVCVNRPPDGIRSVIHNYLLFHPEMFFDRFSGSWTGKAQVPRRRDEIHHAILTVEILKLWLLKVAFEILLMDSEEMVDEFEHIFGLGGECDEDERITRLSYRGAFRIYRSLEWYEADTNIGKTGARLTALATLLDQSETGEVEFTMVQELHLLASEFVISDYVRSCLALEALVPESTMVH
jgi:hypothetical protein